MAKKMHYLLYFAGQKFKPFRWFLSPAFTKDGMGWDSSCSLLLVNWLFPVSTCFRREISTLGWRTSVQHHVDLGRGWEKEHPFCIIHLLSLLSWKRIFVAMWRSHWSDTTFTPNPDLVDLILHDASSEKSWQSRPPIAFVEFLPFILIRR